MDSQDSEIVWDSFERTAPYISNLSEMKRLLNDLILEVSSVADILGKLSERMNTVDVTMKTDIRILLNDLERSLRKGRHIQ